MLHTDKKTKNTEMLAYAYLEIVTLGGGTSLLFQFWKWNGL